MAADFNLLETRIAVVQCYVTALKKGIEKDRAISIAAKLTKMRHRHLSPIEIDCHVKNWIKEVIPERPCDANDEISCSNCSVLNKNCLIESKKKI